ncbi:hypothetical protein MTLP_05100 [Candidatus Methanoliparum sp. LAM-1]|nr:hypothetical protein MTLP_05100 [Candidatus Methanoliparum sp. LAM-1]
MLTRKKILIVTLIAILMCILAVETCQLYLANTPDMINRHVRIINICTAVLFLVYWLVIKPAIRDKYNGLK